MRLDDAARAALHGLAGTASSRRARRAMSFDAVAVRHANRTISLSREAAGQHEPDVALLQDVGGPVADAGLGRRRRAGEAERLLVVVGGLLGVADPELKVVPPVEGMKSA